MSESTCYTKSFLSAKDLIQYTGLAVSADREGRGLLGMDILYMCDVTVARLVESGARWGNGSTAYKSRLESFSKLARPQEYVHPIFRPPCCGDRQRHFLGLNHVVALARPTTITSVCLKWIIHSKITDSCWVPQRDLRSRVVRKVSASSESTSGLCASVATGGVFLVASPSHGPVGRQRLLARVPLSWLWSSAMASLAALLAVGSMVGSGSLAATSVWPWGFEFVLLARR